MAPKLEQAIDRLYASPPDDFVERRDELARKLRKEGDREAADEVKALRKPTVAAWAVNQLARTEKLALRSLLTAGERLRKAHAGVFEGGSWEPLRRAQEDERKAIDALSRAAVQILEETGSAGGQALARVQETLHAAAVDERLGDAVRAGRLVKEEEASGFGLDLLSGAPAAAPATKPRRADGTAAKRRAAEERRKGAERRLREAERGAEAAEQAVEEAEDVAERAQAELRAARTRRKEAERELERARKELARLPGS
jgi:hypothetical protein